MIFTRVVLIVSLVVTTNGAFGAENAPAEAPQAQPRASHQPANWMEVICLDNKDSKTRTEQDEKCLASYAWHWWRKIGKPIVDPAIATTAVSGAAYTGGVIVRAIAGDGKVVSFVITTARGGMKLGTIVAAFGFALTAATAFIFFAMTPSTAPPSMDEYHPEERKTDSSVSPECQAILEKYKTPQGIENLINLPEDQLQAILPCIPQDHDLSQFLIDGAANGQAIIENQVHKN